MMTVRIRVLLESGFRSAGRELASLESARADIIAQPHARCCNKRGTRDAKGKATGVVAFLSAIRHAVRRAPAPSSAAGNVTLLVITDTKGISVTPPSLKRTRWRKSPGRPGTTSNSS